MLYNKQDFLRFALSLNRGIIEKYNKDQSGVQLSPRYISNYPDEVADLEGFSRSLWALTGLKSMRDDFVSEAIVTAMKMIRNGTSPDSLHYWGVIQSYDQKIVEISSILLFVSENLDVFNSIFDSDDKQNLFNWANQINSVYAVDNNWLFFGIIINAAFKKIGFEYSNEKIEQNWARLQSHYIGAGWYTDGQTSQKDYYIAFAYHFYSLLWIYLDSDCKYADIIRERADMFAEQYILFFDINGSAIPYGRSLIYRFAQGAFWSAYILAGCSGKIDLATLKGTIVTHLKWWAKQEIFTADNILSVGYTYANSHITEPYNATGSPYWAMKVFVILLLEDSHDFWKIDIKDIPLNNGKYVIKNAKITICRNDGYPIMFPADHRASWKFPHSVAKYERFCYSTKSGFGVMRDNSRIENYALESTCAIMVNDSIIIEKKNTKDTFDEMGVITQVWCPTSEFKCICTVIPGNPTHIRVFEIYTSSRVEFMDFGFAIERNSVEVDKEKTMCCIHNSEIQSTIENLYGNGVPMYYHADPNTNILYARTSIPYTKWVLNKGHYVIVDRISLNSYRIIDKKIKIKLLDNFIKIEFAGKSYNVKLTGDSAKKPSNIKLRMDNLYELGRKIKKRLIK